MFENLMRELKNMERMQVSFPIEADEDGYVYLYIMYWLLYDIFVKIFIKGNILWTQDKH